MKFCQCKEWKDGIDTIDCLVNDFMEDSGCALPINYGDSIAKYFIYCPWCGKKLQEKKEGEICANF